MRTKRKNRKDSKMHKVDFDIERDTWEELKRVAEFANESVPTVIRVILALWCRKEELKESLRT